MIKNIWPLVYLLLILKIITPQLHFPFVTHSSFKLLSKTLGKLEFESFYLMKSWLEKFYFFVIFSTFWDITSRFPGPLMETMLLEHSWEAEIWVCLHLGSLYYMKLWAKNVDLSIIFSIFWRQKHWNLVALLSHQSYFPNTSPSPFEKLKFWLCQLFGFTPSYEMIILKNVSSQAALVELNS